VHFNTRSSESFGVHLGSKMEVIDKSCWRC